MRNLLIGMVLITFCSCTEQKKASETTITTPNIVIKDSSEIPKVIKKSLPGQVKEITSGMSPDTITTIINNLKKGDTVLSPDNEIVGNSWAIITNNEYRMYENGLFFGSEEDCEPFYEEGIQVYGLQYNPEGTKLIQAEWTIYNEHHDPSGDSVPRLKVITPNVNLLILTHDSLETKNLDEMVFNDVTYGKNKYYRFYDNPIGLPGELVKGNFNGISYVFYSTASLYKDNKMHDYELYLHTSDNHTSSSLSYDKLIRAYQQEFSGIEFVGDLNGDDLPDLILGGDSGSGQAYFTLFLSRQSETTWLQRTCGSEGFLGD